MQSNLFVLFFERMLVNYNLLLNEVISMLLPSEYKSFGYIDN